MKMHVASSQSGGNFIPTSNLLLYLHAYRKVPGGVRKGLDESQGNGGHKGIGLELELEGIGLDTLYWGFCFS